MEVGAQAASETRQLGSREHGRLGLPLGAQSRAGDVIRPGALSPSSKKMLQGAGGDQTPFVTKIGIFYTVPWSIKTASLR